MKLLSYPSPNHDSRAGTPIDMLVLHYTGMPTGAEALARLCDAAAKVSAHYLVEEDGRVFQLVDEAERAWHAGMASWRGASNINARSIGIEVVNPGHEWGYRDFPPVQMEAVAELCQQLVARYAIAPRHVVGHSDVAFARKADPGERFDWAWLAACGVGLWPAVGVQDSAVGVQAEVVQRRLAEYGYGVESTGQWDEQTRLCITAFQRHFRPAQCDGVWDAACEAQLNALLAMIA